MPDVSFTARLDTRDWDENKKAWYCPPLDIPGAEIKDVFEQGQRIDKVSYEILSGPAMVRWILPNPPERISVVVLLRDALTLKSDADWWKNFSIIVPIITAIISGVATYFTTVKPNPLPSTAQMLHLRIEPLDMGAQRVLPRSIVTINGDVKRQPLDYSIKGETTAIIDVSDAIDYVRQYQNAFQVQQNFLVNVNTSVKGISQKVETLNSLIGGAFCSGGSHGIPVQGQGDMAAIGASLASELNNTRQSIGALLEKSPPSIANFK